MTRSCKSFGDWMFEKYLEKKTYRWFALFATVVVAAVIYAIPGPKLDRENAVFITMILLCAYRLLVSWLDYTMGNARRLEDVIWQVEGVQKYLFSTRKSGPLLAIKLTEVTRWFPQRVEFIEISENSPWVDMLTVGKQVRFEPKHRFSLTFPGWEKLYDFSPLWKKAAWYKTYINNYVCGVEEFQGHRDCWIGFATCPGDTLREAYESLAEMKAPIHIPPLNEFVEEKETYNPRDTNPYEDFLKRADRKALMREMGEVEEDPTN